MRVLGFDVATNTGWCLLNVDTHTGKQTIERFGNILCDPKKKDGELGKLGHGVKLRSGLRALLATVEFDFMCVELVQFSKFVMAAAKWNQLYAVGMIEAYDQELDVRTVPVGTLKKFATGKGNADKAQMAAALWARLGRKLEDADDNVVDAIWAAIYGAEHYE